jgi:hypothetical protein
VVLPFYVDWRWFYDRTDSPWFPSAQLFRAKYGQHLPALIPQLREALLEKAGG